MYGILLTTNRIIVVAKLPDAGNSKGEATVQYISGLPERYYTQITTMLSIADSTAHDELVKASTKMMLNTNHIVCRWEISLMLP